MKKYTKQKINFIIEEFELPRNTKFVGYVINMPESDEFLAEIKKDRGMKLYKWSETPEIAIKFKIYEKAKRIIDQYDKQRAVICLLLDTGKGLGPIPEKDAIEIIEDHTKNKTVTL